METLARLPKYGGIFCGGQDELGAVVAGSRFRIGISRVTGSAGPDLAQGEAIGWASMAEIPLIVCKFNAAAEPGSTNVEQSDLHQAIFGSHGDSPAWCCSSKREDCFLHRH